MVTPAIRTLRYVRSWLTGRDDVRSRELRLVRDGVPVPATLLTPGDLPGPLPSWVVLHGLTRPGRAHRQLVRFTRALAEGGCAVLVPEVPEWRVLDLAPDLTVPTVLASLDALASLPGLVAPKPPALLGFSFGAPQALSASAHPDLRHRLAGVAGFGGYCDLERTTVFQLTGSHEYRGERHYLRPDPYGRWIAAANYLTSVPGYEDAGAVSDGLRQLAALAGDLGIASWDPRFDGPKTAIRATLTGRHRDTFDLFAPPSDQEPDPTEGEEMGHLLAEAARRMAPNIEPAPLMADIPGPVHLLHGRQDHLIPFTEMYRLLDAMPPHIDVRGTVTSLFGHSSQDPLPGVREGGREAAAFLKALAELLGMV